MPAAFRPRLPELERPSRPKLEKLDAEELKAFRKMPESAQKKLLSNNNQLQHYALSLEITIDSYNAYADRWNGTEKKNDRVAPVSPD
jgi:hypothetical protein